MNILLQFTRSSGKIYQLYFLHIGKFRLTTVYKSDVFTKFLSWDWKDLAVFELLNSPKLISRKIWVVAEKSLNFHTVRHFTYGTDRTCLRRGFLSWENRFLYFFVEMNGVFGSFSNTLAFPFSSALRYLREKSYIFTYDWRYICTSFLGVASHGNVRSGKLRSGRAWNDKCRKTVNYMWICMIFLASTKKLMMKK